MTTSDNLIPFHFITRCSRPENLINVGESIFSKNSKGYDLTWHIIVDTSKVTDFPSKIKDYLEKVNTKIYYKDNKGTYLHKEISDVISTIEDGYVHIIDDDNILHEDFLETLTEEIHKNKKPLIYVYEQKVDGKDFTGLDIRKVGPEHMKVQHIDIAQATFHNSLMTEPIPDEYTGDGILLEKMYKKNPSSFKFIHKILCYYNALQDPEPTYHLPRVLLVGEKDQTLTTSKLRDFWETRLVTHTQETDENISETLKRNRPRRSNNYRRKLFKISKFIQHLLQYT